MTSFSRSLIAAAVSLLLAAPVLAQTTSPSPSTQRPSATAPGTAGKSGTTERSTPLDINSASAQELDKLPGVGPARAQAIIANRPYKTKDELARRKIVPQNVYEQIKEKIIARQGTASGSAGSTEKPAGAAKGR